MFDARHAPIRLSDEVVRELAARYSEPHRAYHDLTHIDALLAWFDLVGEDVGWRAPGDVYLAILFHDAIYDPTAKDNEARSAALARQHGATERACELIELTAKHGSLTDVRDHDAAHFLDADMAILGASPDVYDRYEAGVRFEYQHVPDAAFRAGRGAFLAKVAALPRIYFTDYFHARLDAQARANVERSRGRLAAHDGGAE